MKSKSVRAAMACLCVLAAFAPGAFAAGQARYFVLVVWDGMRPDFVTPELTPALYALRREGVWFANHHSVFPTTTEVNGAVLATGCLPGHNGILANEEFRPEIDPSRRVSMQSLQTVRRGDELTGGRYLRAPTVAELTQANGLETAIVGAKAVALLHDRRAREENALSSVLFAGQCLPPSRLGELTDRFGPFPGFAAPNTLRDDWATRCLTENFWGRPLPTYSVLWLSEPDVSQHQFGPGSPQALAAIRNTDERLALVVRELDRRGVRKQTDLLVVSDHGTSTIGENMNVEATLRGAGLEAHSKWTQPPGKDAVVVVPDGGAILAYVVGKSPTVISQVVTTLQQQPFAGVIFTRDGLRGTFTFGDAGIGGANAPDVLVATRFNILPEQGAHPRVAVFNDGYEEYPAGAGMHGTLSPTDLHSIAVASGPDFRHGTEDTLPSGNVDIAPTLLWLMGLKSSSPLDGRVLNEALATKGPPVHGAKANRRDAQAKSSTGVWEQYLKFTEVNGVRYLEEGNGHWTPIPSPRR